MTKQQTPSLDLSAGPLPPHDIAAEQAVIGCVVIDEHAVREVIGWLKPEHFYHLFHRAVWECIVDLSTENNDVDVITISSAIETKYPEYAERTYELGAYSASVTYFGFIASYAKIVFEKAQARAYIQLSQQLAAAAYAGTATPALITLLQQKISRVESAHPNHQSAGIAYDVLLERALDETMARMEGRRQGIRTGFPDLDRHTGGFEPGNLVYIAGRPGSGKSGVGLSMARRMAAHYHHLGAGSVCYLTMEMTAEEQAQRTIIAAAATDSSTITAQRMRAGFLRTPGDPDSLDASEWQAFSGALERERAAVGQHLIFYPNSIPMQRLRLVAIEEKARRDLRVLFVDQIDLFSDRATSDSEEQRIGTLSRELKLLARDLGIVVICMVQLNRQVESRTDKHPMLSDLRSSGRLEQDADIVFALYRAAYYAERTADLPAAYDEWGELTMLKYRAGEANVTIPLRFLPQSALFDDWPSYYPLPQEMLKLIENRRRSN